jgi:uncharacterized alpha-E superfamily protein
MLSRVAENLYWIGRYVERAETVVRLLVDAFQLELEIGSNTPGPRPMATVCSIMNCPEILQAKQVPDSPVESVEAMLRYFTFERGTHLSIVDLIARARENARGVQETLSTESWSQLNQFYLFLNSPKAQRKFASGAFRFFQRLKGECLLFLAISESSLPRTEAFHFLRFGRHLERIDMMSRLLVAHCSTLDPNTVHLPDSAVPRLMYWAGLLRTCSAYEAYRRHSREHIDPPGVVRYLLLEEDFPRTMRFAVARGLESLQAISGGSRGTGSNAERHLGRLEGELRYMDIDELLVRGIGPFLSTVQDICTTVGTEIENTYFRI